MSPSALDLLRMLAADAPATELDRAIRTAGPAAGDPAAAVRAIIDAQRRREAGLAALVETARDLASLPEPGGVLDAIVRRARTLVGADVAYLTLHDPAHDDTYMRATAGSVSARFQRLRLPLGAGLGGLVAQARAPHWTDQYPGDERYRHTTEIDAAVAEEGIVAICGVPLLLDETFVGVLFAAHRSRRSFDRDEVALLGSLAALAAVSLAQTRQLAETAHALDALRTSHGVIERSAAAHDRFATVVLSGGDVTDVAAALADLLRCAVVVLDADGHRIAEHGAAPPAVPGLPDPLVTSRAVRATNRTGRLATVADLHAVTVTAAGQHLGTLLAQGPADLDPAGGRTLERAAVVTALVLLFRLRAAEADQRVRTDLLAGLLTAGPPDTSAADRARLLGIRLDRPHLLAVLHCPPAARRGTAMAAATLVGPHGLAGEHAGAVVVLQPCAQSDPGAAADDLARRLGTDATPVTAGAAGPVRPDSGLVQAHAEAVRCADALVALGRVGTGAAAAGVGFAGLLLGRSPDLDGYLDRVLGPLLAHDADRGTRLLGTVEAWLEAGESPRRAAAGLHVHVNTVSQRLDRVSALLGPGWQRPDRLLEVRIALHLHRLRS